jgi:hypothetical protein
MTIAVSILTNTAAIFAADSKLTTRGLVGFDTAGEPQFVNQTYDNATKIASSSVGDSMAVVAGGGAIGPISVTDYIASSMVSRSHDPEEQARLVREFAQNMAKLRAGFWKNLKVPLDQWPITAVMLALAPFDRSAPRVWHFLFGDEEPTVTEIKTPIYLEGSYDGAYSLLYGYRGDVMNALAQDLKVGDSPIGEEAVYKSLAGPKVLRPIDKIATPVMPLQDAIDLAVFLATAQVQMERFLPGEALCGGPIDVMVWKSAPRPEILWLPGKEVRHPVTGKLL